VEGATADVKVKYIQGRTVVKTVASVDDSTLAIAPGARSAFTG